MSAVAEALNPEGLKKVAGGRSVAKTTGVNGQLVSTLKGCKNLLAPRRGANSFLLSSGGLRYAPTTGYSLSALQAERQAEF